MVPSGDLVILRVNYEETQALRTGARALLDGGVHAVPGAVLAPAESRARVEELLGRLQGDLSISTLAELRRLQVGVEAVVERLRIEMESMVLSRHPADEVAVAAYFDFAHALAVSDDLREMREEMEAMIELVTGAPATLETARTFRFPD